MKRATRRAVRPGAFTLVESVATIVVLSILGVVASRVMVEASARYTDAATRSQLHARVSSAMERISEELRDIRASSVSGSVGPDIASDFSASTITFTTSGGTRTITYNAGSQTLTITGDAATDQLLAEQCSAFSLAYFDAAESPISPGGNQALIRRVSVSITLTQGGVSEFLRTKVFVRSLMSGSGAP